MFVLWETYFFQLSLEAFNLFKKEQGKDRIKQFGITNCESFLVF